MQPRSFCNFREREIHRSETFRKEQKSPSDRRRLDAPLRQAAVDVVGAAGHVVGLGVGAGVLASSLCMDKVVFKEVLAGIGDAGAPGVAA